MKCFAVFLCLAALSLVAVSSFALESKPAVAIDEYWPKSCPVPDCEKYDRPVKYPSPQARNFYQCISDGKRWIPHIIPCPCYLLFSYEHQQCVFPWNLKQWCTSDYVVDILPTDC